MFRITKRSDDAMYWFGLAVLLAMIIGLGSLVTFQLIQGESGIICCGIPMMMILVGLLCYSGWVVVIHPYEWEVVLHESYLCWGRSDQPELQKRVAVDCIKDITVTPDQVYLDAGRFAVNFSELGLDHQESRHLLDELIKLAPHVRVIQY